MRLVAALISAVIEAGIGSRVVEVALAGRMAAPRIAVPPRFCHACFNGGDMRRKEQVWAMVAVSATPVGGALGRLHLIGPNPGTFFALGILAALSAVGVVYGLREGQRARRAKEHISN
jgi:hypothetical protein